MYTLEDLEELANQFLRKTFTFKTLFGTPYSISPFYDLGYTFQFDNAKRRLGCCHYTDKMITMSRGLAEMNLDKLNAKLTDTILHEIAHALSYEVYGRDGRGHGSNWINIARQIGSDGIRCYDSSKIDKPQSKYTLTCPTCSKEVRKHRRPRSGGYACGKCCNGKYDSTHEFIVVQNY